MVSVDSMSMLMLMSMSVFYIHLTCEFAKPPTHPLARAPSLSLFPFVSLFGRGNQGADVSVRTGVLVGDKRSLFEEPSDVFRRKVSICVCVRSEKESEGERKRARERERERCRAV